MGKFASHTARIFIKCLMITPRLCSAIISTFITPEPERRIRYLTTILQPVDVYINFYSYCIISTCHPQPGRTQGRSCLLPSGPL